MIEIAAQRYEQEERVLSLSNAKVVSLDGGSWPIEDVVGLLEDGQILGKGARGPNPAGMQVLTFGVQVAEVAVDVETGEIRVERIVAIHDVGRVINPLSASSQVEGGIIQGIGHTLSEDRLLDPASGITLDQTLDAYKLPTIADVPEIVTELLDIPDEQLTNLGSKGLGEPPIVPTAAAIANAIRDATGADVRSLPISREEMLRALAEAPREGEAWSCCSPSLDEPTAKISNTCLISGGTEVVPLLRDGLLEAETLVDLRGIVPRGVDGTRIGAGTTLGELEVDPRFPRRSARRAGWPRARSSGTWARSAGTCSRRRAAGTGASSPCRLHGGDVCHARRGEHREHAIFGNDFCASAHPSDPAAALIALRATMRTTGANFPSRSSTGCRTRTIAR